MKSTRTNGGLAILCHLLALPTNGSSLAARSAHAFAGPASCSSRLPPPPTTTTTASRPIPTRHAQQQRRRVSLFSTRTDRYGSVADENGGVDASSPPRAPEALGASGNWAAYLDESKGLIYYFNPSTGESKWEPPEDTDFSNVRRKIGAAKKVEMRERLKSYLEERLSDSTSDFVGSMQDDRREMEWKRREAGERLEIEKSRLGSSTGKKVAAKKSAGNASKQMASEAQNESYLERNKDAAKANAAGRGTKSDGGSEPAVAETKTAKSDESRKPAAEAKPNSLPIVQQGDWSAHFDIKSGVVFYFNERTGKNSWDPPFDDFPRIGMDNTTPTVLDPGSGNISMERALGYIGVDEMAEALAWEEAKKKERARKVALRANEAKSGAKPVEIYEPVKESEPSRLEEERKMADVRKTRERAAAKLAEEEKSRLEEKRSKRGRLVAETAAAKEREAAAKLAVKEKLERKRLEKERLEKGRIAAAAAAAAQGREAAAKRAIQGQLERELLEKERLESGAKEKKGPEPALKRPVRPKEDPTFTVKNVQTMVAPLETRTLYDVLRCPTAASRAELKRSYLSLAKQTHPDALLQKGIVGDDESERKFLEISQAWKTLGDSTSRRRYDREIRAKGISSKAGNVFENWVAGAAKAMDEALAKAENDL